MDFPSYWRCHRCGAEDPVDCQCYASSYGPLSHRFASTSSSHLPVYDAQITAPYHAPFPGSSGHMNSTPSDPFSTSQTPSHSTYYHQGSIQYPYPHHLSTPGTATPSATASRSQPAARTFAEEDDSHEAEALADATGTVLNANGKRQRTASTRGLPVARGGSLRGRGRGSGRGRGRGRGGSSRTKADYPLTGPSAPPGTVTGPPLTLIRPEDTATGPRVPVPAQRFSSILQKPSSEGPTSRATDVWWVVYPVDTAVGSPPDSDAARITSQPCSKQKPDEETYPRVACRFCRDAERKAKWQFWQNQGGQTTAIRNHMQKYHGEGWRDCVISNQLKGWEQLAYKTNAAIPPAASEMPDNILYSQSGLEDCITDWIAADDQALNVVESDWFRRVLIYASHSPRPLTDKDIPRRTHVHDILVRKYERQIDVLREQLKTTLGRVSFTCDLWTCRILRGYLAITVHFCAQDGERIVLRSRLGAFRHIPGRHTGVNLAQHFFDVLQELGILDRVGCITLDNASNCDTMLEDLERLLREHGVPFHRDGNRLRCFPHVVNISVTHGLAALTQETVGDPLAPSITHSNGVSPDSGDDIDLELIDAHAAELNTALRADPTYAAALQDDPVKRARQLVTACRASGLRREAFAATIAEGNKTGAFGEGVELRPVQLLRDVSTRWSSTFMMIDRLLELYPAVQQQEDIAHLLLTDVELTVLKDIRQFLELPHLVQELLSAEQTPTASQALPAYERLLRMLKLAKVKHPKIAHAISASSTALEKYMQKTRQTRVYALAMVLNPYIKFQYLDKEWAEDEQAAATQWVEQAMLEWRRYLREKPPVPSPQAAPTGALAPSSTSRSDVLERQSSASSIASRGSSNPHPNAHAARALNCGLATLEEREAELLAFSQGRENVPAGMEVDLDVVADDVHATETEDERKQRLEQEDEVAVRKELQEYREEILPSGPPIPLLEYWQNSATKFPYLYRVALDILPVPASSVPCERVFSSSKETDTLRRTGLDAAMMEILQVVKYSLKQGKRESSFTGLGVHANTREDEMLLDPLENPWEAAETLHLGDLDESREEWT